MFTTCAKPLPFSAETSVCEARPRAKSLPVPQPPPALASADGSAAPTTTASCARACCSRSRAISSDGFAATARSTSKSSFAGRGACATIAWFPADHWRCDRPGAFNEDVVANVCGSSGSGG